jgi:hypothetical protein
MIAGPFVLVPQKANPKYYTQRKKRKIIASPTIPAAAPYAMEANSSAADANATIVDCRPTPA